MRSKHEQEKLVLVCIWAQQSPGVDIGCQVGGWGCRGIDVVRNKIKMFAQKKVTLPPGRHKIVILDEADRCATRPLPPAPCPTTAAAVHDQVLLPCPGWCAGVACIWSRGSLMLEGYARRVLHRKCIGYCIATAGCGCRTAALRCTCL